MLQYFYGTKLYGILACILKSQSHTKNLNQVSLFFQQIGTNRGKRNIYILILYIRNMYMLILYTICMYGKNNVGRGPHDASSSSVPEHEEIILILFGVEL